MPAMPPVSQQDIQRQLDVCAQIAEENAAAGKAPLAFVDTYGKDLEGISQKVLTDSLRSLEEDGVITRTVYPEVPPRVEYALSELGESMRPIMDTMEAFGLGYQEIVKEETV